MKGDVKKRGERKGEAVEKRPDGEAERDAARAEDRVPLEAGGGGESRHGALERPLVDGEQGNKDRRGLADTNDREPHDHES